ncbi:MAG: transglutaminase domain-containing protein [Clostridiales bacterium]|nr:transglutaminase domain-containing protein [Clostridiales bacterium]
MLRLPDRVRAVLVEAMMLALTAWALTRPMLQVLLLGQERGYALGLICLYALLLAALPLLGKRLRALAWMALLGGFGLWAVSGPLPGALAALLDGVVQMRAVQQVITLYADALMPPALLLVVLYARLLMHGEPGFSAPLLLSSVLMIWFSGARQGVMDFVPAMVAMPLLFVYANHMDEPLRPREGAKRGRGFLQAVPIALVIALLALALTPPYRTTQPEFEKQADRLRQYINDYFFFTDSRENFSLASAGYQPMGERGLGGKPEISNSLVMEVQTDRKVYLRGSILNLYNGRMWYDTVSNERYGYASLRYAALRDTLLDARLPEPDLRAQAQPLAVHMLGPMPSTLFTPQRVRSLSLGEGMVAYLNASSEMFITRNLEQGDRYELTYEPYLAATQHTDDLAQRLRGQADPRTDTLDTVYRQLPQHLQPNGQIAELARRITGSETDPYRKALLIRSYLKTNYTYTLDVPPAPEDLDFAAHFLFETKKGYCTYFATAMTVLARSAGLNSRYVEGFVALPTDDGSPAALTGQQAHAWTEVYIPQLGWVTFDATATTGELPPPPEQDPPPPGGPEPTQTPEPDQPPQDEPTPSPSPEPPEDQPQEQPPEPSPTPPPGEEDMPEPEPDAGPRQPPARWWLWLLLIAFIALIVWRVRATEPNRHAARLPENKDRVLVYWRALVQAMAAAGHPMLPSETLRGFARRAAPQDKGLLSLASTVSAIIYGRHGADEAQVTAARLHYQSAYSALNPWQRAITVARRVTVDTRGHIGRLAALLRGSIRGLLPGGR